MLLSPQIDKLGYLNVGQIGPLARFGAQTIVGISLVIGLGFGNGPSPLRPIFVAELPLALMLAAIFLTMLVPRPVVMKLPISLSAVLLVLWIGLSYAWSVNPGPTRFELLQFAPLLITVYVISGYLSLDDMKSTLVWIARFIVVSTFAAVAFLPETRLHVDEALIGGTLEGWHGLFSHKNSLSPVLVMGLLSVMAFDDNRKTKFLTISGILVLLFMSTSVTGISGAMVAVFFYAWYKFVASADERSGGLLVAASFALAIFASIGAFISLGVLVNASGKDMTFTGRTDIWTTSLEFISDRPIQGYGVAGLFSTGGAGINSETAEFWRSVGFEMFHAHNGLIDITLQLGIVGLFLFILLFGSTFTDAWRQMRLSKQWSIWMVSLSVAVAYMSISEAMYLGGWLMVILLMKVVLMRLKIEQREQHYLEVVER